ncbi:DNA replication/repair protein RecF [Actinomyces israelii]|uniref:DNA replication and repair protein RecF n=1 Tax=Actinomyces israelii TaxID=1659 RepID=A0ABT4I9P5_9ACTO|nr:DNA replication/repair protein RecF [Actinomyces israelii]MCZ0858256.1 DNA replication/repair protein RecF [Actinomyces israelii]
MYVSDLALSDFRSYDELVLALEPGPTAFIGPNGQGKTNLVEAVAYLSTLSSHRAGADTALVRRAPPGEPQPGGAVVRAKVVHGGRPSVLEIEIIAGRANRARLNRGAARPRDLLGILRAVVFAPEDLALVREEPGVRRRFLDDLAVTLRPALAGVRAEHDKILSQRASLLKAARAARRSGGVPASMISSLEVWDAQLAAAAARLMAARTDVVARLRPWAAASYERVSQGQSAARLSYRSSLLLHEGRPEPGPRDEAATAAEAELADVATTAARLETAMAGMRGREIDRGANLVGAHRDDLILHLGDLPAKGFASHGEQWSLALALRLASYEMLRHDVDAYGGDGEPVLILDDVFASLDAGRRAALADVVAGAQQALLTAAVDDDVPAALAGTRYRVSASGVSRG